MTHKKLPTIWPIGPHTIAKHQILEEYLKAWFPIVGRWTGRIVYLDGFAGPGKYKDGEDGSPIIAMRTAVEHTMIKPTTEIVFGFIENDKKRSEVLKQTLEERFEQLPQNVKYNVIDSNFEKSVCDMLDSLEENEQVLAPTFAFIDPFGYSDFSMNLVKRLLNYDKSEVLITFMTGFVNRFLDPVHEEAVSKLYGSKDFLEAKDIPNTEERINFLLKLYEKKLKENNGAKYVRSFEMVGHDNNVVYHLIFGTKHWKGLEVIKRAMLKVDSRGMYSFSDRIGFGQTFFVNIKEGDDWMPDAAELIFKHFRGQSIEIDKIHRFVITDTPYMFKKKILTCLEKKIPSQILRVTNRKTKTLSYPDRCVVTFSK
ncbi:hypothetical protein C6990_10150 [Nitrosopumilus sp. b3]|uniref:three-Cys-motif partner protein TcmP n=1 Tax=Nitrosopumilus sp. b3 TaxID=2109909 RepID=UPI0015F6DDBD|nr:three-Cys-motif partner protein TcmP [Nitrosopumilus sp. b3]KAF6246234.1 hypothetical protein C6990_10150 [Nitrosopumilus sp. b3]